MTALHHARQDLADLLTVVDQLAANLLPGTARPWRVPKLSAERRQQLAEEARQEILERSGLAPGESPAPYSLEISELLVEILSAADLLHEATAQAAGVERLATASSAYADPKPYLRHVREHLIAAADSDSRLVRHVIDVCTDLLRRSHEALGLTVDGQVLSAVCPWCHGRNEDTGVQGDHTLRVRLLPGTSPPEPVVVCEGVNCTPPEADCGTWLRGRPAWRQHEWDWLAKRLGVAS